MSLYSSDAQVHPRIIKILWKQQQELLKKSPDCVTPVINDEDPLDIQADIEGPQSTPYENGIFRVKFVIPPEFPQLAPKGYFMTKIFHPNISEKGEICVNTLKRDWNPQQWSLYNLLEVIKCLLIVPFPQSSLNEEAGKMFMENYDEYFRVAKMFTQIHAKKKEIVQKEKEVTEEDIDMIDCSAQNVINQNNNSIQMNQNNQNISQNNGNVNNPIINNFTPNLNNNIPNSNNNGNINPLCDNRNNNNSLFNGSFINRSKTVKFTSQSINLNFNNPIIKSDFFNCSKMDQTKSNYNQLFNNNLTGNNNMFNPFQSNDLDNETKRRYSIREKPNLGALPSMLSNQLKQNRDGNKNFGFSRSKTQTITYNEDNNNKKSNQDEINKWLMRI